MASASLGLTVGRIPFLVCSPFFHEDTQSPPAGIIFRDGPPSWQNRELFQGNVQLAPSSSFAYAKNPEIFHILPEICTGSTLEIRSVKLFSHRPIKDLNEQPVHLTPQSGTSIALLKLLCNQFLGIKPRWVENNWGTEPCAARLLIGDQALQEDSFGAWAFRYDLASLWQQWQGLPFVFGMWIVHNSALQQPVLLQEYREHLSESIMAFRAEPRLALEGWTKKYPTRIPMDTLLDYFEVVDYRFTEAHKESLAIFFRLCYQAGMIPEIPHLYFL